MMFELNDLIVEDILEIKNLKLTSDVVSIEGQSGSGKSTLLRLLNNLDDPAAGSVLFHEDTLSSIPPQTLRKKIVMVPQSPVMFDGTIRDNLQIGRRFSGEENAPDTDLKETLDLLWLEKDLDTDASDLSGGEQQRVALGRVLLLDKAEVYLLDEPSSDLDDKTSAHVMKQFIATAKKNDKQTVMVTHDKGISKEFAETVINMDEYSKQIEREDERT